MLDKMNRYWRATNYLCIGQIYLFENPLVQASNPEKMEERRNPFAPKAPLDLIDKRRQ